MLDKSIIEAENAKRAADLETDFNQLAERLDRKGIDINAIVKRAQGFGVAVPSWGTGTGGTRFARFPGEGEPANIFDKLDDCGVIHTLTRAAPSVSLHIPWDKADPADLKAKADEYGLSFDAMNSNTFQDQPDQTQSYKYGSLSHTNEETRAQAVEHNLECIEIGKAIGSRALTVWIGDGANFPGQTHMGRQFERYLDSMKAIYKGLPDDWRIFSEHKIYEPAFYSTVVQDWGTSLLTAQELGEKAMCLVDLGHHAPNVNIEMIVSRLIHAGKLGGFHFNDSKYGDDDLDSGTIDPYRLFLVWNELVDAENTPDLDLAHMIDQSHNVTDPIESLMVSSIEIQRAFIQASLVDRKALAGYQSDNDALMASATLRAAFRTDVDPILAKARELSGGAIDPIETYRASGYRAEVAAKRPKADGSGGGIV
ncbi:MULTISPECIES: L-rhamnose catabolism isomerase [Halocynthiibacter]|uniref:L-rhamnose catabolism isomerase n=1 Tax=Halocynthiibacter halioticoli TaxID=2986804 RepID=A0AAE3LQE9_9RHOB|nr:MULTISPECIES: L-rhamnose catabolism isomerase [Halocynthiibacter]MCV6823454.1 L-rhamnose catabolism isomerase [Halocynthiibacter halioticoli]MCW4056455.1 L-rhamnose catabolism isomerase [Halocynthiibacter sp. SDUM655004]